MKDRDSTPDTIANPHCFGSVSFESWSPFVVWTALQKSIRPGSKSSDKERESGFDADHLTASVFKINMLKSRKSNVTTRGEKETT
jgi:hypothetical protein